MEGVRLHVVTGKGGTGKTTVAAALALALSREGRRVLLVEVEGRQGIAQLFDVPPLPYEERKVAPRRTAARCSRWRSTPRQRCSSTSRCSTSSAAPAAALQRIGAIDFATTIAPGMRDVLLTGKVYEAVGRTTARAATRARTVYDAVVLDAPPTGRITRFLDVNARGGRAGQGRPDPQPGRLDHPAAARRRPPCTS